jgi:hypothetical protein
MRLAAEFQGFARDLHDLAIDCYVRQIDTVNPTLGNIIRIDMTRGRQLDRGNAQSGSLGSDFSRLGLLFWDTLDAASNNQSKKWRKDLDSLNLARNAIAHDDQGNFFDLRAIGKFPITLRTITAWLRPLDALAITMDDVVSIYLGSIIKGPRPW